MRTQMPGGVLQTEQCTAVVTLPAALVGATSKPDSSFAGHEAVLKALMFAKQQRKEQDLLWWHTGMLSFSQEVCRIFDHPREGCLLDLRLYGPATSSFHKYKIINYYSYNIMNFWQVCSQEMLTDVL